MELGVKQRFSNIEHPWENGKAERSFQTLFRLSRSLLKHTDLPDKLWGKAILHSIYLMNRSPTAALEGLFPLQFRTMEPFDLTHMRVFGSPAQIFVRGTIRDDKKLSDRSVSRTFVGISDKGNGYIFLIQKSNTFVEIDSKYAKFNETFSDCRAQQGKLITAHNIDPDLRNENNDDDKATQGNNTSDDADTGNQRPQRQTTPREFLIPGTHLSKNELDIRQRQYVNVNLESIIHKDEVIFILQCMEAQTNDESKLMKELELLNACTYNEDNNDVLLTTIMDATKINLTVPDPKSQNEINKMDPNDAKRFNDATIAEV